jgi:hypothetical protein
LLRFLRRSHHPAAAATAAGTSPVQLVHVFGIPIDFILFALADRGCRLPS